MTPEHKRVFTAAESCMRLYLFIYFISSFQHLECSLGWWGQVHSTWAGWWQQIEQKPHKGTRTQRKLSPWQGDSTWVEKKAKHAGWSFAEGKEASNKSLTRPAPPLLLPPLPPTAAFQFVLDWYTCTHHLLWLMPHPNHNKNQRRGSLNASLTSAVRKAA